MKIFLDTANFDEIKRVASMGLLDGVTTNPSLVSKETGNFRNMIKNICDLVKGPVSAEVISTEAEGMIEEGKSLAALSEHVVIKVPMTPDGLVATRALTDENIPVNVTLIFSASQALLAAKAGAAYVSPFIGRLDDISATGMDLIAEIRQIFDNYTYDAEILAASLRHPVHFVDAARIGADISTLPPKVFHALFNHPLTDSGLATFLKDWEKVKENAS